MHFLYIYNEDLTRKLEGMHWKSQVHFLYIYNTDLIRKLGGMHQGKEPNKKETMRRGHKPASCGRAPWSQAFWNSQVQEGSPDLGNLVLDDRCQHGRAYF